MEQLELGLNPPGKKMPERALVGKAPQDMPLYRKLAKLNGMTTRLLELVYSASDAAANANHLNVVAQILYGDAPVQGRRGADIARGHAPGPAQEPQTVLQRELIARRIEKTEHPFRGARAAVQLHEVALPGSGNSHCTHQRAICTVQPVVVRQPDAVNRIEVEVPSGAP